MSVIMDEVLAESDTAVGAAGGPAEAELPWEFVDNAAFDEILAKIMYARMCRCWNRRH